MLNNLNKNCIENKIDKILHYKMDCGCRFRLDFDLEFNFFNFLYV